MRRLFPSVVMSISVAIFWLLLNNTLDPAHVVFAVFLGWLLAFATRRMVDERSRLAAPWVALRLSCVVVYDVIKSNIDVAILIIGPKSRIRSRFIEVPCDLGDPKAVAALAGIITMTPGTLSVDISEDRRTITIHSLHAPEPELIVAAIKNRYERPLGEIFSCLIPRS